MSNMPADFRVVIVVAKASVHFDGKVVSHTPFLF
jgi:hypothetical protein